MKDKITALFRYITLGIALFGTASRILDYGTGILFYFTIQSNIMVCLFLALSIFSKKLPPLDKFLHNAFPAVLLYISITGLIFNTILGGAPIEPTFYSLVAHINHTITPVLFLVYWLLCCKPGSLKLSMVPVWLVYPILYLIFSSIEGGKTGHFRYYFLDFVNRDVVEYTVTIVAVFGVFFLVSLVIFGVNKYLPAQKNSVTMK